MMTTVEGLYKRGKIELLEMPLGLKESRVLVTFLPKKTNRGRPRQMTFGQFAGERMSTEDDFKIAEWHGEPEEANGD